MIGKSNFVDWKVKFVAALKRRRSNFIFSCKKFHKLPVGQKIAYSVAFVLFLLFSLSFIYPFLWLFLNSFKDTAEYFRNFNGFPEQWVGSNYVEALFNNKVKGYSVFGMMGVSIMLSVIGTILTVFTSSCAAYIMAKYKFRFKSVLYGIVIFSLIVPIVGSLPAQLRMLQALHIYDSPVGVLFMYSGAFGTNFLLLYSFFKGLGWSYAEAAFVDGASNFTVFAVIMMPMARGALVAISILQLIGLWNDYMGPALFMPSMPSLAVGLEFLVSNLKNGSRYPEMFATVMITILPILLLFVLFSKTITENVTLGGLKG